MQEVFVKRAGSSRVIVFALGWAGSDELIRHLILPDDCDLVCLFDYRDLAFSADFIPAIQSYPQKYLVAWSFGVWAATRLLSTIDWADTVAINGTPKAIDDRYGIPRRAFELTVRGIRAAGTQKFLERMCGDHLRDYYRHRSTRPLDEIVVELERLGESYVEPTPDQQRLWKRAVVGGLDAIFPPENMLRYWQEAGVEMTKVPGMPHYPLYDPEILVKILEDDPTR